MVREGPASCKLRPRQGLAGIFSCFLSHTHTHHTHHTLHTQGPAVTKFRKGACENCGAMTHKTKECVERPRKLGARWTGRDIQADEVVTEINTTSWDFKRDRWNGYDPKEHDKVIEEHEK